MSLGVAFERSIQTRWAAPASNQLLINSDQTGGLSYNSDQTCLGVLFLVRLDDDEPYNISENQFCGVPEAE